MTSLERKGRFISENSDIKMNEQERRNKIMAFLRRELRNREEFVLQLKASTQSSEPSYKSSNYDNTKNRKSYLGDTKKSNQSPVKCSIW